VRSESLPPARSALFMPRRAGRPSLSRSPGCLSGRTAGGRSAGAPLAPAPAGPGRVAVAAATPARGPRRPRATARPGPPEESASLDTAGTRMARRQPGMTPEGGPGRASRGRPPPLAAAAATAAALVGFNSCYFSFIKLTMADDEELTMANIKEAIQAGIKPIQVILDSIEVKERNSHSGLEDALEWPPRKDGQVYNAEEPITINTLLVAGNETLPNGTKNTWNSNKSRAALRFYGDGSGSESEGNEYDEKSRARRLRLARKLGISRAQLNFAQLAL
jgi:hypothetical protein